MFAASSRGSVCIRWGCRFRVIDSALGYLTPRSSSPLDLIANRLASSLSMCEVVALREELQQCNSTLLPCRSPEIFLGIRLPKLPFCATPDGVLAAFRGALAQLLRTPSGVAQIAIFPSRSHWSTARANQSQGDLLGAEIRASRGMSLRVVLKWCNL